MGGESKLPKTSPSQILGACRTPTTTSCHLSQMMEIEQATTSGCSVSQPALQWSGLAGGWGLAAPHLSKACMSPSDPGSGCAAALWEGKEVENPRLLHAIDKAQNFLSGRKHFTLAALSNLLRSFIKIEQYYPTQSNMQSPGTQTWGQLPGNSDVQPAEQSELISLLGIDGLWAWPCPCTGQPDPHSASEG